MPARPKSTFTCPELSNEEKDRIWRAYRSGKPERVPVALMGNNRLYMLDPRFNTEGLTYEETFRDAEKMLHSQLRWQEVIRSHYHRFCDYPTGLPEKWQVAVQFQNVSEAWFFGCEVNFKPGQVPDTTPILTGENKRSVFDVDISRPLERDPYRRGLEFCRRMTDIARSFEFRGRPVEILPYLPQGTDGPMTVAMNLRGGDFLLDLVLDPRYADELMGFILQAAINRTNAVARYWDRTLEAVWFADDSIETISLDMYREKVLPHHKRFFDALDPAGKLPRTVHLCGDACRHFPVLVKECGVRSIDTGFPVDFARLRKAVGPEVEILGGVEVALLMNGTPEQVYARAKDILTSGVLEGRRFVLREANNLPPMTPEANLAAMYRAGLDFGM